MRWLLMLVLLAPTAQAAVAFEIELQDARGDTVRMDGRPVNVTEADIVSFRSSVVDGRVRQRVEMSVAPQAPADSILVRSWYHNSTNGSWHAIDLEVRGDAPDASQRFKPFRREGDFFNVTVIDATYGVEGNAWVFEFDAALVAGATCFDPGVFSEHTPARGAQGLDALYLRTERPCRNAQEPETPRPPPPIVVGVPSPASPAPTAEPPGSRSPTPGFGAPLSALAVVLALAFAARRGGP